MSGKMRRVYMRPTSKGKVVADKEKFSIRLGVPSDTFDRIGKPLVVGGACAATGAFITSHIIGSATVIKVLGITLYASSGPVGWAIGAAVVAGGAGCSAYVLGRKLKDRFGNTGTYRKDFDGNLSEIGELVADIVFRPMVALAASDWSDDKGDYIIRKLEHWGYDGEWAKVFLQNLRECKGDVLGDTVEMISNEGFDWKKFKDDEIQRKPLFDLAVKQLEEAALDLGGDSLIMQERKEEIVGRLKDGFRN